DMHHIISDGVSSTIFTREFHSLYTGQHLPELNVQYKDYAVWQATAEEKKEQQRQKVYWHKQFKEDNPILDLPLDFERPKEQRFEGDRIEFPVTAGETAELKSLALKEGATMYMILLAIYNILLTKISNQEIIIAGTPTAGRRHTGLESVIGMFVNTLPLKNQPAPEKTFLKFLREVKQNTLDAFENQDYPFEELIEAIDVPRDTARNPLFDVMFLLHSQEHEEMELPGLKLVPYKLERDRTKFDLTLQVAERKKDLYFNIEYAVGLFKKDTIHRFAGYFKRIVTGIIRDPERKIGGIEIMTGEERQKILYDFNDTRADYPGEKSIHQLFEEQAVRTADHIALVGRPHS
ncbi:MAG: non-ribosomal peptide synthetase, partial [bacterium]|nr:non-ribosomal peptide synthetase [bacterium]